MFCPNCGNQIPDGSVFCSSCGTSIPGQANQQADATPQAPSSSEQPQAAAAQPQQQAQAQPQPQAQAQPGYQQAQQQAQPGYQQAQPGYQQPAQQVWPPQTPANRALAMSMYWSLLSWIFVLAVRDKNDPFITHHLNNVTVIIIGSVICSILMFIIIGIFGLIFLFVVEIIGTVSAYHGDMKPLPLISKIKIIK